MKKILLLSLIFLTVIAVKARVPAGIHEIPLDRTDKSSYSVYATEGIIENISVFPNPVVDILKVSFKSSRKTMASIALFNNIGKQVFSQEYEVDPGNNVISIDIRSKAVEPGIYFIQCVAEKEVFTRKLIVK